MAVFNKTSKGLAFSEEVKNEVWNKAKILDSNNKAIWRVDACGKWIRYLDYGNRQSEYGWEIDHIRPLVKKGDDDISNLRALHWQTNEEKGDKYPWKCGK